MENNHGLHSARRVNFLSQKLEISSYVEIGVNKGYTFNNINTKHKHAIDPKLIFNYKEEISENIKF